MRETLRGLQVFLFEQRGLVIPSIPLADTGGRVGLEWVVGGMMVRSFGGGGVGSEVRQVGMSRV